MSIRTPLTDLLGIRHPILLAPMGMISGGALAAAVTHAGGLGHIGGGYGDRAWLERELKAAGNARIGVGFITWSLEKQPDLLDLALDHAPATIFLSFGDFTRFAPKIVKTESKLVVQVQTLAQAREAVDRGVSVIVAQGTEAGGHGGSRATLPLVPAVVDVSGGIPVVAAGGIGDGRGLAAALMLGASGVLCGTTFYASREALSHPNAKTAAVSGSGDNTFKGTVVDTVRGYTWPAPWRIRTLRNPFVDRMEADPAAFASNLAAERSQYAEAAANGDFDTAAVIVGEGIDLVKGLEPAGDIVSRMAAEAEHLLAGAGKLVGPG